MHCHYVGFCALSAEAQAAWIQAIGSIAALFIAIGIAWVQSQHARTLLERQRAAEDRQRRLLAKPQLWCERFVQRESPQMRVLLRNDGLGPAVVKEFDVYVDGVAREFSVNQFWVDLLHELDLPPWEHSGGTTIQRGRVIPPGTEIQLLKFQAVNAGSATNAALHAQLVRVDIVIAYESIYGDEFEYDDREG